MQIYNNGKTQFVILSKYILVDMELINISDDIDEISDEIIKKLNANGIRMSK